MNNNKKGFTLAEVLITLTIIGVVAALTIPSLLANVSDKTYEAKRKGFATRMAQAISQLDALNSYKATRPSDYSGEDSAAEYARKYSAMNFVTEGLSKVYKITNTCEYQKLTACDFPESYGFDGSTSRRYVAGYINGGIRHNFPTDGIALRTKNGESMLLWYNQNCTPEQNLDVNGEKSYLNEVCVVIVYDLDGAKKGPNVEGKDIGGLIVMYSDTPYVVFSTNMHAHDGSYKNYEQSETHCKNLDESTNKTNGSGLIKGAWTLPTKENYIAMSFAHGHSGGWCWTNTIEGPKSTDYGWLVNTSNFRVKRAIKTTGAAHSCVPNDKI